MSTRMSFLWNLAAERRLGGRQWKLFLDCETLRKMTADRCITLGGHWGCLRTWKTELEGDAHQPLVICLLHRKQLSDVQRVFGVMLALKKEETLSFIFTLPLLLFYFCSSSSETHVFLIKLSWRAGQVPMGMVDLPTAPERWGSSFVSLPCFAAARLSHDVTHI